MANKSIYDLINTGALSSLAFQESASMKAMREMAQSHQLAIQGLQESASMKAVREMVLGSQLAAQVFQESASMKAMREMVQRNQLAIQGFQEPESMKAIRKMFDSMPSFELAGLSSLKAVSQLENSPFAHGALAAYEMAIANPSVVDEAILEIDSELNDEIASVTDFDQLSEKAKGIFLYIYHQYFLPLLLGMLGSYIMMNTGAEVRNDLESVSTLAEIRSYSRTASLKLDRDALGGFRVTTANSLRLRKSPNMSSETMNFLPRGTLVEVIDKSNRAWLFVEVEINGELLQGWLSRKHTIYFK